MADPNEMLRRIRQQTDALLHPRGLRVDREDLARMVARNFAELDAHLSGGGEPPIDWRDGVNDMPAPGRTDTTELRRVHGGEHLAWSSPDEPPVTHLITSERTTVMEAVQDQLYRHKFAVGTVVELTSGAAHGGWSDTWYEGMRVRVVEQLPTSPTTSSGPIYAVRDSDGLRGLAYESEIRL